ncbi:MAG: DUF3726 domain-containing protein [Acidiferrobacterales bacterium]|nr:DUF3726 domain-containing protein [Acidiferrobacterales bacterium]
MSWSLSECRALSLKAARGAGLSWGLAEEVSNAAVTLESAALPGLKSLSRSLNQLENSEDSLPWLLHATYLLDSQPIESVTIPLLDEPLLFAALLLPLGKSFSMVQQSIGNSIVIKPDSLATNWQDFDLNEKKPWHWHTIDGSMPSTDQTFTQYYVNTHSRIPEDRIIWIQVLENLASRTYAPDTEESRIKGAGAGLTDND